MNMNTTSRAAIAILMVAGSMSVARAQKGDSVVVNVGKESRVIFLIRNQEDLNTLKHYNLQSVVDDMVQKLEKRDSTPTTKASTEFLKDTAQASTSEPTDTWDRDRDRDDDDYWHNRRYRKHWNRRTYHSFNMDVGMNNYLEDGNFPASNSLYTVKPWGSWYVGMNSVLRTRVTGKFFIEWGGGVSWYNFKFENERVTISKDDTGVIFAEDVRDLSFQKSKLTAAYVNLSLVPMIDFGGYGRKSTFFDGDRFDGGGSFRIGFGPYAGYRIDSYSKQMYMEDGGKEKEHNHDSFYMNNIRYGLRLQLGFRDTDIFFNYDMNELFVEGKGPKLNAFSFGVTL